MSSWETNKSAVEPELLGPTPRRVRYTGSTQAVRIVLLLVLAGGITLMLWLASRDQHDLSALLAHGATTSATVTDMEVHSGKSTTYEIDYAFTAAGVTVSSDEDVSESVYHATNIGDPLLVTYLPSHPETHRVGLVDAARIAGDRKVWALGTLAALLVLGLIVAWFENAYRSHRRLLENGVPVTGEITDRDVIRGKNTVYYVSYHFPGPGGIMKNTISVSSTVYNACDPNTAMTVLYDPMRPNKNRLYRALKDVALG